MAQICIQLYFALVKVATSNSSASGQFPKYSPDVGIMGITFWGYLLGINFSISIENLGSHVK
jgi:hypothetical protein